MTSREQIADEIYRCLGIRTSEDMYYFNYTNRIPYIIDYILERERKARLEVAERAKADLAEWLKKTGDFLANNSFLFPAYQVLDKIISENTGKGVQ